jgi:GT2 family glycosyltransferase
VTPDTRCSASARPLRLPATRASVVVAPRERLTSLPGSLRSLFATLPSDLHVVVVEGGTPDETRAELRQLATDRPFDLVSLPYMVKSNEARNLGVTRTSSEFVIIADNDIEYEPGWFEALAEHALANRSDAASPLVCIGPPPATVIHQAGGRLEVSRVDGEVHLGEVQRLMDVPLADVEQLPGVASDICEFHCIFVRRSLLDEMGGLDERLVTREHIDFAMRALVLNAKMTFCERAVVTYMARDVLDTIDVRYHLFRWADRFVVESLESRTPGASALTATCSATRGPQSTAREPRRPRIHDCVASSARSASGGGSSRGSSVRWWTSSCGRAARRHRRSRGSFRTRTSTAQSRT